MPSCALPSRGPNGDDNGALTGQLIGTQAPTAPTVKTRILEFT